MSRPGYDTCDMCGERVDYPRRKLASMREHGRGRWTTSGRHFVLCDGCYRRVKEFMWGDDLR